MQAWPSLRTTFSIRSLKVTNCQTISNRLATFRPLPASRFLQRFSFYFERCSCHTDSCATGTNLLVKLSILSENIPTTCPSIDVFDYTCVHERTCRAQTYAARTCSHRQSYETDCALSTVTRSSVKYDFREVHVRPFGRFWISILADCTREIPARGIVSNCNFFLLLFSFYPISRVNLPPIVILRRF